MSLPRPSTSLALSPTAKRAPATWAVGLVALVGLTSACGEPARCAEGACPVATVCDPDTGACIAAAAGAASSPLFAGDWHLLALDGVRTAAIGYDPRRRSLVFATRDGAALHDRLLAGPASGDGGPAGEVSTAAIGADGVVHVVWLRRADGSAWYGRLVGESFEREPLAVAGGVDPSHAPALTMAQGQPALAFVPAQAGGGVHLAVRDADGIWRVEAVPGPPASAQGPAAVGASLHASAVAAALSVAWHDPVGGDLIVASRTTAWQVSRLAGRDGTTGADQGDAGAPLELARDLHGGLVVAWRDRTHNHLEVARSLGGAIARDVVTDGAYLDPATGVQRRVAVAAALDVAVLANGRLAVAWQDGSRVRVELAVQTAQGTLQRVELPLSGRPQLRPRLLPRVDGTLWLGWLELEPSLGGGRLVLWSGSAAAGAAP